MRQNCWLLELERNVGIIIPTLSLYAKKNETQANELTCSKYMTQIYQTSWFEYFPVLGIDSPKPNWAYDFEMMLRHLDSKDNPYTSAYIVIIPSLTGPSSNITEYAS